MKLFRDARKHVSRRMWSRLLDPLDCETDIVVLHPYGVIYFAVPKVANTSLKATFSRILAPAVEDLIGTSPSEKARRSLFRRQYRSAMYARDYLICKHEVSRYGRYVGFAFVRNPWDRLVSCYKDKLERIDLSSGPAGRGTLESLSEAGHFSESMTFKEFALAVCEIPDARANRHFRSQLSFLRDRKGSLLPGEIYRFENLGAEFARLAKAHGLPQTELPHFKSRARRDYRDYYDDDLAERVRVRYEDDVEAFGYSF